MKIDFLKKKDIEFAVEIVGLNYPDKFKRLARSDLRDMFGNSFIRPTFFMIKKDNEIVGFAGFSQSWMDYNIYEICWVNVHPEHQNKGFGKLLVEKLLTEIKKNKNATYVLLTADVRKNLHIYYEKYFGFKEIKKSANDMLMILHLK